ncbi:putative hemolysin [Dongia mobilis]|uniref:Putative hemolysin n=1 Tax=Dongia mobilis TaxID=578943 RepID=A0A4R6WVV0_9PROT|nr:hemolysin family protein [Dongia mobilis]TDQ84154.1 putative hemolysin [Dongia mobilis]
MPEGPIEDTSLWFEIVVVLLLILLNGFFAMSELAIVSARRVRLKASADHGNRGARTAIELAEDPTLFLATVQIGITLVGIVAGAYSGATFSAPLARLLEAWPPLAPYAYPVALGLVVAGITYLSLIVGELVPKRLALRHAEAIAMRVSLPMAAIAKIGAPLVYLLRVSTRAVLALLGQGGERESGVTEEDVKSMLAEGTETGVFAQAERHMIEGVLHLADYPIRSIMTPRPEIDWIDINAPLNAVTSQILTSRHSRLVVCQGSVDEVLGVAPARELLQQIAAGHPLDIRANLKPALTLHETTPILRLLELFRQAPMRFAIVLDEYGSVEGIVTLADIFAVIAGEMAEPDQDELSIAVRDESSWLIDGRTRLIDVERKLGASGFIHPDYSTLAGLVLHRLGHLPRVGERLDFNGFRLEVVDLDGRRIDKILVERLGTGSDQDSLGIGAAPDAGKSL